MSKKSAGVPGTPAEGALWQQIAIFAFGVALIAILLVVPFVFPCPSQFQSEVTRILLPLAAAAVATRLTGFIRVHIPNFILAGGAFAIFSIVYFYNPAGIIASDNCGPTPLEVDINRIADWMGSGCSGTRGKRDVLMISDAYHIVPYSKKVPRYYKATANVYPGQSVKVYDLNVDGTRPAPPVTEFTADTFVREHWNLVVQNGVARARYIWKNADVKPPYGIYFTSYLPIRSISAHYILPVGKSVTITSFDPPGITSGCRQLADHTVKCDDLNSTDPVIINWSWNMWDACKKRPPLAAANPHFSRG